jgi:hypothetical protein
MSSDKENRLLPLMAFFVPASRNDVGQGRNRQRTICPLPLPHEKLDTELDLECLGTQATPKDL